EEQRPFFKPELMQSVLEINTRVCETVREAADDLREKLLLAESVLDERGLLLWWGATHPFSHWQDQKITPDDRYLHLVEMLQEMARRLCTFGLHVHVGVDSGDKAVMICDRILQHLPTLLALTCSSPFWEGRDTGLQSMRSKIMEGLPTAGLPPLMRNWSEYTWLINHMVDTGFINTIREIWWDVRPHHNFGTVEVRVCDMPGDLRDVLAITALIQTLVKALSDLIDSGTYQHDCHPMMVRQNKWRACRFGNQVELVNSYTHQVQTLSGTVDYLIERLTPAAQELQCYEYLLDCRRIAREPTWAERQLALFCETKDPREVVRRLTQAARVTDQVS
ncbi:MAG TPA: YbdK family carboxylate-amine ligase, partial [Planctomycetaceae bacterium]|nr:YbdK family carboxylate-amine ligase [Planctomycetaceae bacterium]